MLLLKKERIEKLIIHIDTILKGEDVMNFEIFTKTEIQEMFKMMFDKMPDKIRQTAIAEFGRIIGVVRTGNGEYTNWYNLIVFIMIQIIDKFLRLLIHLRVLLQSLNHQKMMLIR